MVTVAENWRRESGSRTHGTVSRTRFPSVLLQHSDISPFDTLAHGAPFDSRRPLPLAHGNAALSRQTGAFVGLLRRTLPSLSSG